MRGMDFLVGYLNKTDENSRLQFQRLASTHSIHNLNIHPHYYYYWIEAWVLTARELDNQWYDNLEFYWREIIFFPISYIISRYFESGEEK